MAARFPELTESDLNCLIEQKNSDNTKRATKVAVSVFRQYLGERKVDENELLTSKVKLVAVLRKFYAEARKKNGELYMKASLVAIRFGLQRFFSSLKMDIIKDSDFAEANTVFQAEISELRREGKAQTQDKPPISNDLKHCRRKFSLKLCFSSVDGAAKI